MSIHPHPAWEIDTNGEIAGQDQRRKDALENSKPLCLSACPCPLFHVALQRAPIYGFWQIAPPRLVPKIWWLNPSERESTEYRKQLKLIYCIWEVCGVIFCLLLCDDGQLRQA